MDFVGVGYCGAGVEIGSAGWMGDRSVTKEDFKIDRDKLPLGQEDGLVDRSK